MADGHSIIKRAQERAAELGDPAIEMIATYATELRAALCFLRDAFVNKHGSFPADQTSNSERLWHAAMSRAYELVGGLQHSVIGEIGALDALQRKGAE